MIPNTCIVIKTDKFPILQEEEEETINEGMYGKALCLYLQKHLTLEGIEAPFFCAEDWGWWIEIADQGFSMGLCIYAYQTNADPFQYAIISSIIEEKKWSWKKLQKIDVSSKVLKVLDTVEKILKEDKEIFVVGRYNDVTL